MKYLFIILLLWVSLSMEVFGTNINWAKVSKHCEIVPLSLAMNCFLDTKEEKDESNHAYLLPVSNSKIHYYLFPASCTTGFFFKQEADSCSYISLADIIRDIVSSSNNVSLKIKQLKKIAEICEFNVAIKWNENPSLYYDGITWVQLYKGKNIHVGHQLREMNLNNEMHLPKDKKDLIDSWMNITYGDIQTFSTYEINAESPQILLIEVTDQNKMSLGLLFSNKREDVILSLERVNPMDFDIYYDSDAILVEILRRVIDSKMSNRRKIEVFANIMDSCYPSHLCPL